jgi:hypothetical protein
LQGDRDAPVNTPRVSKEVKTGSAHQTVQRYCGSEARRGGDAYIVAIEVAAHRVEIAAAQLQEKLPADLFRGCFKLKPDHFARSRPQDDIRNDAK